MPLPWMLGPLIATAVTRMAGLRTQCPRAARNGGQWVIGTSLGLYFTPQVVEQLASHALAVSAGALLAFVLAAIGTWTLRRFAALDLRTAWFAAAIGGASEMSTLAERYHARVDQVATVHSLRVLLVVVLIPFAFQTLGVAGNDPTLPGPRVVEPLGLTLLVVLTCAAAFAAHFTRMPNAWVLGPLAVGIALTSQSIELSALPTPVLRAGQLLIGWSLGDRYRPDFLRSAPRLVRCVALLTLALMALSAAFAWMLSLLAAMPFSTLTLATTPGGIAEMALTAKALQLGVPTVTAFHVVRMVLVVLLTEPLYRWVVVPNSRAGASG